MQLVANGPDLPDALMQAHEEGCVVFFCGAGISYPKRIQHYGATSVTFVSLTCCDVVGDTGRGVPGSAPLLGSPDERVWI